MVWALIFGVHSHRALVPWRAPFRTWDNETKDLPALVSRYGDVLHTLGPTVPTVDEVRAIVAAGVTAIEVWNEPEMALTAKAPGDAMALSKMVYQAAKAANPNVRIVSPGTTSPTPWLRDHCMSMDPCLWFDVVGLHVGASGSLTAWWDAAESMLRGARAVLASNGHWRKSMPIWITETEFDWATLDEHGWCRFFKIGRALQMDFPELERIYCYAYDQRADSGMPQIAYNNDAAMLAWSSLNG